MAIREGGLYHLATPDQWADHQATGIISPASLRNEGFVHCSWGRQVAGTAAKHFDGEERVLALEIDPALLGPVDLVEEDSYGSGQEFPHVYGPIPLGAVTEVVPING